MSLLSNIERDLTKNKPLLFLLRGLGCHDWTDRQFCRDKIGKVSS